MTKGQAGKGDTPRPFNQKKWDEAWANIEKQRKKKLKRKKIKNDR